MKTLFNNDWFFSKLHLENADQQVDLKKTFDSLTEKDFSAVELPHDWLIYNTKDLYESSIGFYKKDFELSENTFNSHSRFFLRFEGVYMDSKIYINDQEVFEWKYGYTTFESDITPFIKKGINTIAVIVVYRSPNTRWYSGAGIYRNVWLISTQDAHIVQDGVAWSTEKTGNNDYLLNIQTETVFHAKCKESQNEIFDCFVTHTIFEAEQKKQILLCGKQIAKNSTPLSINSVFTDDSPYFFLENQQCFSNSFQKIQVKGIKEWCTDEPNLYLLKTELCAKDGTILDSSIIRIGFCTHTFDKNKGYFLNGKHLKIHGVCMHHDLGALGAAFNKCAARRQLQKLKKMGVNAIRTSHNPYAPAFLDLADELGFLIDSECYDMWEKPKTHYDYSNFFNEWSPKDTASWIRRDRSHVCVFMWSIGNEIYDTHQGNGLEITKKLVKFVRQSDTLKKAPVTIASNYIAWQGAQRCMQEVDLAGYNYTERLYEEHHKTYPEWCIYGSETSSTLQSRGIYHFPADFRNLTHDDEQCSCLENCSTNWGATNSAAAIIADRNAEFCMGQFIWTGFDYIGEPTPYFTKNSYFGQIDTAGFEKDTFYAYQAEWTDGKKTPMVHLLPYWDFNENQLIDIRAYSNCARTELFLNDVSLGIFDHNHKNGESISGKWQIPYEKGILKVKAYDENNLCVAEDSQVSFEDPVQICLSAENAECVKFINNRNFKQFSNLLPDYFEGNGAELVFISISTKDKNNNFVSNARNRIKISVKGGNLLGLDNGDSTDFDQYKTNERNLFSGRLVAIIEPQSEKLIAEVSSSGLAGAKLTIENGFSKIEPLPVLNDSGFIPIRNIKLCLKKGSLNLNRKNQTAEFEAKIFPENATSQELLWQAVRLEGVNSDCVKINNIDNSHVILNANSDGSFRLRCSCKNRTDLPQVISEYEMTVTDFGSAYLNPFEFVSGCKATLSLNEQVSSFQGGLFFSEGRNWIGFENVDFGKEGADLLTIPIFSFDNELQISVWDGTPDDSNAKLLDKLTYKAQSKYNHYQANTWKLPHRLFGLHTISFETEKGLSLKGFVFEKTPKAFSVLSSLDADIITGDSFKKSTDAVLNIGNNVSFDFYDMDFGENGTKHLKINGRSPTGANTIQLRIVPNDSTRSETVCVMEIPENKLFNLFEFDLPETVKNSNKVTFIFLPGSNFDFKDFQFC